MFDSLKLNNFRGFGDFSTKLKPITLISGRNNTGKTSILESIFLYQDCAYKEVFLKLPGFRGINLIELSSKNLWDPLFYNMDTSKSLSIIKNEKYSLHLEKNSQYAVLSSASSILEGKIDASQSNYALSCNFTGENQEFSGDYVIGYEKTNNNFAIGFSKPIQPIDEPLQYLGPHTVLSEREIAEKFGKLELNDKKQKIIDILKIIDNDIKDIKDITTIVAGNRTQLYFTNAHNIKLPLDIFGDGTKKILYIVLALLTNPKGTLLLDEIENGLHYSLFPKLWEAVALLSKDESSQVIATTHSYECISGALEGVKNAKLEDLFAYVRLDKDEGSISPKIFENDMLEYALDSDWEVR